MRKVDQQLRDNDCGVSSVKTIYNILGKDISRSFIQEKIFLNEKGSRISDLKKFLDSNGCETSYKIFDVNYLNGNVNYLKTFFPFILPIEHQKGNHYVVVNGIRNKKLKVYDPTKAKEYFLTVQELKKIAHFADSYWNLLDVKTKLNSIINDELTDYKLNIESALEKNDESTLFNKLTYFCYLKENFGFKNEQSEKNFLEDLIYNQDISLLPKHFRSLKLKNDKVRVKAPIILTADLVKDKKVDSFKKDSSEEKSVYIELFKELGNNKKLWYIYVFAALFAAAISQCSVFVNQVLIDHVLPSFQLNVLILFAIGVGVFKLFDLTINMYKFFVSIHVGNILDKYFLNSFDNKLNQFSISYIHTFKRGDLTQRLSDSLKLKSFFLRFFTRIMVDIAVSLYSLGLLFFISWKLALIVCTVIFLFYCWFKIITPHLKTNERKRFVIKADLFSKIIEKIDGIQVIKSFRIENDNSKRISNSISNLVDVQTKTKYIDLLNNFIVTVILTVASLFIIIYLAKTSIETQSITIGQLMTFILLSDRIFGAFSRLLDENLTLQENEVILRRYLDFKDSDLKENEDNGIQEFQIEQIKFLNIQFGYLPELPVLRNINLTINQGEKIKIEGQNGSGKSSFCKILSLIYPPKEGQISINEIKHSFYNNSKLREKILLVSNEDILFNETIEYNITLGRDISPNVLIDFAKRTNFYEFILENEEGLDYIVNENGKNLSTGQRKKILLMRALLSEAEVIILDEVLSGLDIISRQKIESMINNIENKILIIISHESISNIKFNKKFNLVNGELWEL